jgi:hypothetical protein
MLARYSHAMGYGSNITEMVISIELTINRDQRMDFGFANIYYQSLKLFFFQMKSSDLG